MTSYAAVVISEFTRKTIRRGCDVPPTPTNAPPPPSVPVPTPLPPLQNQTVSDTEGESGT